MNKRNITIRYLSIIILATSLVFIFNNSILQGYLHNEASLDYELWTKGQNLSNWDISKHAPYKNRILFKEIVSNSHSLFFSAENNTAFFYTYIFWSLTFFILAAIAFFYLLKGLHFNNNLSLLGVILFLTAPPVMLAYTQPSHTREDPLAYLLLCLGLLAIVRKNYLFLLIICIAGVFCRETLLIIPFVYLFFTHGSILKKLAVAILPFMIWTSLRFYLGIEKYELLEMGLFYNMENYSQSIYFIGITFYVLWIPFLYNLIFKKRLNEKCDQRVVVIRKSAPWVFLLVISTTIVGGKLSETRLLFLLFPWVITIFLLYVKAFQPYIFQLISHRNYQVFSGTLLIVFALSAVFILQTVDFPLSQYRVPYNIWAGMSIFYLYLSIIALPIIYYIIKRAYLTKEKGSGINQIFLK